MSEASPARSRQALLLTAALFSTGGVAIKSVHLPGVSIACLRSGFAAVALMLALPGARRNWNGRVLLLAIAYALTLVSFTMATKLTTSANAIFLQDAAPLYIFFLSIWFLKEKPRQSDFWFMLPVAAGLILFFAGSDSAVETAPNPPLGNLIAAASGICYATVVVGFRWLSRAGYSSGSLATVGLGNTLAFLLCLPFALPINVPRTQDWLILIYLGVFQIALAYFLMTRAMQHVPALEASLLLLLEPVLNPVWTWAVYREQPGHLALAGGALILVATAARTWWSAPSQNDILRTAGQRDRITQGRTL